MASFEIYEGRDEHWYWHLVGDNGEIMAQGEGYATKGNAKRAVTRFIEVVGDAAVEDIEGDGIE